MSTVTIEEAQVKLPEIVDKRAPGEELIVTRSNQLVATLVGQQRPFASHASREVPRAN